VAVDAGLRRVRGTHRLANSVVVLARKATRHPQARTSTRSGRQASPARERRAARLR
jgi:hypothetical protein